MAGINNARVRYPELSRFAFMTSSDAHFIEDIGSSPTAFCLEAPSFVEIGLAFRHEAGRHVMEER